MLGQVEFQVDAGEHRAREDAGNQDPGDGAGENHEEEVVAGVDGGEDQDRDDSEVDHAFAGEAVVNLIDDPAEAGATGEVGNDGDGDPGGHAESEDGGDGGEQDAALLGDGGGKERDRQS